MTNGHGMSVPGTWPKPSSVNADREVADPARAEDDQRKSAEQGERPEGHDERRQARTSHQEAVHQATQGTDREDRRNADPERDAGGPEEPKDRAGEPGHRLDGQVDLAGHDDQRHRQRHDRDFHQGGDEIREVAGRQEERRQQGSECDEPDQGEDEEALPARDETRPSLPAVGGRAGGRHRTACLVVARWRRRRMTASALTATRMTRP